MTILVTGTGEGMGEGLAYLAEADEGVTHDEHPIRVGLEVPGLNGAGLSDPPCDDLHSGPVVDGIHAAEPTVRR